MGSWYLNIRREGGDTESFILIDNGDLSRLKLGLCRGENCNCCGCGESGEWIRYLPNLPEPLVVEISMCV